jgi:hypothetical protein
MARFSLPLPADDGLTTLILGTRRRASNNKLHHNVFAGDCREAIRACNLSSPPTNKGSAPRDLLNSMAR